MQIGRADITPQIKWAVYLEIADGDFDLPQRFYRYMRFKTLYYPEGF